RTAVRDRPPFGRRDRAHRQRDARRRHTPATHRRIHPTGRREHRSQLMSDARIEGYARALFEIARAEGTLDEVEDELFRFARSYESSDALRTTLTDENLPAEKRQAIVEDLLDGKATATTAQPVSMAVGTRRGRGIPAIVDSLLQRASSAKNLDVAEVRTAVPLTSDQ